VQFIDVRDIARWIISATELQLAGPFNVTGPSETLTMKEFLQTCRDVSGKDASFTWVTESFLLENDVTPFTELPLWLPQEAEGMVRVNIQKARRKGLAYRPLTETVRDTLNWSNTRLSNYEWLNGLQPQRETTLLEKWHKSH
jgi:2'-hydroxyisoflavone reductase